MTPNANTLPLHPEYVEMISNDAGERRESVEIFDDFPVQKRRFSIKSKKMTPSSAFSWNRDEKKATDSPNKSNSNKPVPSASSEASGEYFHGICYRAPIRCSRSNISNKDLEWSKFHLIVVGDVFLFFSAPKYEFESRINISAVRSLRRVRVLGKSAIYFSTLRPFILRFQTRNERTAFSKIMPSRTNLRVPTVNLSRVEVQEADLNETVEEEVFIDGPAARTHFVERRGRFFSVPDAESPRREVNARAFRSLKKTARRDNDKEKKNGILSSLKKKSAQLRKRFF